MVAGGRTSTVTARPTTAGGPVPRTTSTWPARSPTEATSPPPSAPPAWIGDLSSSHPTLPAAGRVRRGVPEPGWAITMGDMAGDVGLRGEPGLRRGAIGLREGLFQSVTAMAPGAAIAASILAGAAFAGGALPLSVLVALVPVLATA